MERCSQLLEVAIVDVMAAPIGDGVELNTMGELHLPGLGRLAELELRLSLEAPMSSAVLCCLTLPIDLGQNLESDRGVRGFKEHMQDIGRDRCGSSPWDEGKNLIG